MPLRLVMPLAGIRQDLHYTFYSTIWTFIELCLPPYLSSSSCSIPVVRRSSTDMSTIDACRKVTDVLIMTRSWQQSDSSFLNSREIEKPPVTVT